MENFHKNIAGIRSMMEGLRAEKYAIVNPETVALEEYVKELYLRLLGTVVQYGNEPADIQILFLKRLICGIGAEGSVEDYMRRALEITASDAQEFLSLVGNSKVKYYFAADGLLLVSMGTGSADSYEYLAELIELLEIKKEDLEYVCEIVRAVLQQQSSYYDSAKGMLNERVEKLDFTPYIQNFYAGVIVDTDTEKHYSAPDKSQSRGMEYPKCFREWRVVFENLEIDMESDWTFQGCEEVVFKNCSLNGKGGKLWLSSVGTFRMQGCKAVGFENRVAYLENTNNITIEQCEFLDCGHEREWLSDGDSTGGVFCVVNNLRTLILNANKLLNCYIKAKKYYSYSGVTGVFVGIVNCEMDTVIVEGNEFSGCSCINNGCYKEAYIGDFRCNNLTSANNKATGGLLRMFERDEYNQ